MGGYIAVSDAKAGLDGRELFWRANDVAEIVKSINAIEDHLGGYFRCDGQIGAHDDGELSGYLIELPRQHLPVIEDIPQRAFVQDDLVVQHVAGAFQGFFQRAGKECFPHPRSTIRMRGPS